MTRTRKKTLAVLMALSVVIPGGVAPTSEAAAKKVKLSKTKVSIQVGKTKKISIKNAKKGAKVTWKTSNKKVVKIVKSKKRLNDLGYGEDILTVIHENFANIDQVAEKYGPFDFLLADLGVSSMQIDNPERGFSYKNEGPLDLRLNPEAGIPASQRLKESSREELEWMLRDNSDEPYAAQIARIISLRIRKNQAIETTTELAEAISEALSFLPEKERKDAVKKSCARVFQALRIDVNSEFEVLDDFLQKLPSVMAPGGRIAILTFHSGEDRMVKKALKEMQKAGFYSEVATDVIRPSAQECARNPRARSTKMRWAVKA